MNIVIVRDNIVENIGTPPLGGDPPEGATAHEFDGFVSIGWLWNDGVPENPNPPPPPGPAPPTAEEKITAVLGMTPAELKALLAAIGK